MEPLTRQLLAGNPYRTLGLSSSASRAAIEDAARRMRIWPDPSRVPPTPWDFPALGEIRRSKPEIEQAVAQLSQPGSRLEYRLLWFGTDVPPTANLPIRSASGRHSTMLAALQAAWLIPEEQDDGSQWAAIIAQAVEVCADEWLASWVAEMEAAGRFDKVASPREISEAVAALPTAVVAGVIRRAMSALDQGRIGVVATIASAVRQLPTDAISNRPDLDLLDRIEDFLIARCGEMEKDLRDNLKTNRQNPEPFFVSNYQVSTRASEFYVQQVLQPLNVAMSLCRDDRDRTERIKTLCGDLLVLLALGWEWSGHLQLSEEQLQQALKIAAGTVTELEVQRQLERVSLLLAEQQRDRSAPRGASGRYYAAGDNGESAAMHSSPPQAPRRKRQAGGRKFSGYAAILIIVALFRAVLAPMRSSESYRSNDDSLRSLRDLTGELDRITKLHTAIPNPTTVPDARPADPPRQSIGNASREP